MFCTVDKHSTQHWVHKLEAETSCPLCIHQKWSIQAANFDRNIVRKFDLQRCHASGDVFFSFWCILFFGIRKGKWSTSRIPSIQNDLGLAIFNYVALIVAWDYDFWHFIVHPLNTTKWNSKVSRYRTPSFTGVDHLITLDTPWTQWRCHACWRACLGRI